MAYLIALTKSFTPSAFKKVKPQSIKSYTKTRLFSSTSSMKSNILPLSECLKRHAEKSSVFIDGSWHLGARDGRKEYETGPRITNAHYFDIDDVATQDTEKNLPHMMPPKELFAKAMDHYNITPSTDVILYGTEGCFSIPRVFCTFKAMGHPEDKVHMMQGSLKDWMAGGGPVEDGEKESMRVESLDSSADGTETDVKYDAAVEAINVVGMDKVLDVVNGKDPNDAIIIDARSAGRFVGEEPEPRPGLRGGHMPQSLNVPFNILLDIEGDDIFLSKEEMVQIFQDAGVDVQTEKDVILTCGSGVTACWLAVALEECGRDPSKTYIYDGSWIEWASDDNTPVVK